MLSPPDSPNVEAFERANEMFARLVERLSNRASLNLELHEVEALIREDGTELLRYLLQECTQLRPESEEPLDTCQRSED